MISILDVIASERPRWILWLPVGMGVGIGIYFALPFEPSYYLLILPIFFILMGLKWPIFWPCFIISLGFDAAFIKTHYLNTYQINRMYGPVMLQGTLEKIEYRPKDKRLTFKYIHDQEGTPLKLKKIRLVCRGLCRDFTGEPHQVFSFKCVLLPPQGPPHPHGYDFRRHAYFEGMSAVGYITSRPHPLTVDTPFTLYDIRHKLTQYLRNNLEGVYGHMAAALITGDRSGLPDNLRQAFANAGVAHVLAISGLHLSLVAGLFFFFLRLLFVFMPFVCLKYNTKKIAAFFACLGITCYLCVCHAPLSASRAYIMAVLVLGAILLDRFALSLRNVALAASILLLFIPEALISPSFHLSFAAVIVLIAGYETYYTPLQVWISHKPWLGKIFMLYGLGILLSTILSTLATTPYIMYTFHHLSLNAIPANMLIIPLISFVIMPCLLLFLIIGPLSHCVGLTWILTKSLQSMIDVALYMSTWKGSHIPVKAMSTFELTCITLGLLVFFFIKHPIRYGGLLGVMASFCHMYMSPLPDYFIAKDGKMIGFYEKDKPLRVNTLHTARFARKAWMAYSGQTTVIKDADLVKQLPLSVRKKLKETIAQSGPATYVWVGSTYLTVNDTVGKRPWSVENPN